MDIEKILKMIKILGNYIKNKGNYDRLRQIMKNR